PPNLDTIRRTTPPKKGSDVGFMLDRSRRSGMIGERRFDTIDALPRRNRLMLSRRQLLAAAPGVLLATEVLGQSPLLIPPRRDKAASKMTAVVTSTYHYLSHAYHICGR